MSQQTETLGTLPTESCELNLKNFTPARDPLTFKWPLRLVALQKWSLNPTNLVYFLSVFTSKFLKNALQI